MAIENGHENGIRTMARGYARSCNPQGGISPGSQESQAWDNILSKMFPNSSSLRTWDMDSQDHPRFGLKGWWRSDSRSQKSQNCSESWLILTTHWCNLWIFMVDNWVYQIKPMSKFLENSKRSAWNAPTWCSLPHQMLQHASSKLEVVGLFLWLTWECSTVEKSGLGFKVGSARISFNKRRKNYWSQWRSSTSLAVLVLAILLRKHIETLSSNMQTG